MDRFSNEAISKMGYYVYRLVDPRNGQTFYVEFNHIEASLCQKLTSPVLGALKIFINGVDSKTANCSNTSKIKIIYE